MGQTDLLLLNLKGNRLLGCLLLIIVQRNVGISHFPKVHHFLKFVFRIDNRKPENY